MNLQETFSLIIVKPNNLVSCLLPVGTLRPFGLVTASRNTLESAVDPSHPDNTYMNLIYGEHTPNTFIAVSPFCVLYLAWSIAGARTGMYVPSNAPRQL